MSSNHWKQLYNEHADDYERMVQFEDYEGNLLAALDRIRPLKDASVVICRRYRPHYGSVAPTGRADLDI